jgi:ParB-like chromosome segregation protein Spo0J
MTLRWIALEALEAHPENANRMAPDRLEKLKGHIERTGRYEALIVRPTRNAECGTRNKRQNSKNGQRGARYQILNGHHRARVLRELGHRRARCDVWTVGDEEARVLLATLNRLQGRDDPQARAALVARLAEGRSEEDLAGLLPEATEAVERLVRLAEPPPAPASPEALEPLPEALTFFLSEEQHALVLEALRAIGESREHAFASESMAPTAVGEKQRGMRNAECGMKDEKAGNRNPETGKEKRKEGRRTPNHPSAFGLARAGAEQTANPGASRAERLAWLALWYLESIGRR